MKKVKIIEITDHIFTLEDEDKNIYKRAFQFINTKYAPTISDYLTLNENILEENKYILLETFIIKIVTIS